MRCGAAGRNWRAVAARPLRLTEHDQDQCLPTPKTASASSSRCPSSGPRTATFEHFLVGANGELLERLKARGPGADNIWLFGQPGVGKTHLLLALCERHADSAYIPAKDLAPTALEGYARFDVVAIDDVPCWLAERPKRKWPCSISTTTCAQPALGWC